MEAAYHSHDFDVFEWAKEAQSLYTMPECTEYIDDLQPAEELKVMQISEQNEQWNEFYTKHSTGDFFKPRRYLVPEFKKHLIAEKNCIVEVGCGYGCSMFPIIEACNLQYIATDYSAEALQIMKTHPNYNAKRSSSSVWDVTRPCSLELQQMVAQFQPSTALAVFALSAVHPDKHMQCLINIKELLRCSSVTEASSTRTVRLLFRDYGIHDVTMYRHKRRHSERLFGRADGTLAVYFDLEYMQTIAAAAGWQVEECEFATVCTSNRRTKVKIHRVYVHAVLTAEL